MLRVRISLRELQGAWKDHLFTRSFLPSSNQRSNRITSPLLVSFGGPLTEGNQRFVAKGKEIELQMRVGAVLQSSDLEAKA